MGRVTKKMVPYLKAGDIPLIAHRDLDEVAVESLLRTRVKVVLNCSPFVTGLFINSAPLRLLESGVHLIESLEEGLFDLLEDGEEIQIHGSSVAREGNVIAVGQIFDREVYRERVTVAEQKAVTVMGDFLDNTLSYASRERELFLGNLTVPHIKTDMRGRDAVVVVRGKSYREDLHILRHYLKDASPILIGVDGGGDALLEAGFRPHIVIGDMDSISDKTLFAAREIIVHAYVDKRGCPGAVRVKQLGLDYTLFTAPGTSEDIALLLAYEKGAELIVALGTHFGFKEFLEKGRKGMASTFLARLKVADRLVDAKGVSRLYRRTNPAYLITVLFMAGMLPVGVILILSPLAQHFFRLIFLRLRLGF